jgi:glycosyl transferase family 87
MLTEHPMGSIDAAMTPLERWSLAARRAGTHSLAIWPPITIAFMVYISVQKGSLTIDLAQAYLPAAHKILHSASPYPPLTLTALKPRTAFIYPPLTAWLVVPLAAMPLHAAEAVGVIGMVAAVVGTLLLLDVRDWRCHMIAFLWVPTFSAIQTANLALPVALGTAAIWRYRDRPVHTGVLTGLLIALKLYVWPLGVWLLLTRRWRHAAIAVVTAPLLVVCSWAPIGFAGLRRYPHLLQLVTKLEAPDGYTIAALLAPVTSWRVATAIGIAAGLAGLAYAWQRVRCGDERGAYVFAVAAALMLTPIVWMSYFVVLLVPLALYAPRFAPIWLLPLALWAGPQISNGAPWQTALVLCVAATVFGAAVRHVPERAESLDGRHVAAIQDAAVHGAD